MAVSVHGLSVPVAQAISAAFESRPPSTEVAVVGVEVATGEAVADLSADAWNGVVDGVRAAFFAIRAAAAAMLDAGSGGRVIVVVPAHAVRTSAGCGLAAVAGSFLTTVAQVAAAELGPSGISVNVLAVGPLVGRAPEAVVAGIPAGRLATPEDVAAACAMLASPEAAYVNGAVVTVDGGYSITKAVGGSPFLR